MWCGRIGEIAGLSLLLDLEASLDTEFEIGLSANVAKYCEKERLVVRLVLGWSRTCQEDRLEHWQAQRLWHLL